LSGHPGDDVLSQRSEVSVSLLGGDGGVGERGGGRPEATFAAFAKKAGAFPDNRGVEVFRKAHVLANGKRCRRICHGARRRKDALSEAD